MEPNEGGWYNSSEEVKKEVSSIADASSFPDYVSSFNVEHCGPDIITTTTGVLTNGVNCSPNASPGAAAASFGGKAGFFSEITEIQDISFNSARQLSSSHFEEFESISDLHRRNALKSFSPPDIISSSGKITSAAVEKSSEVSHVENYMREDDENINFEYDSSFKDNEDLRPSHFFPETTVDETYHRETSRDPKNVAELTKSNLFRPNILRKEDNSETEKPLLLTMQNDEQMHSFFVKGRSFAESVDSKMASVKTKEYGFDFAEGKDADNLMPVTAPALCPVGVMPLNETGVTSECFSFSRIPSVDRDELIKNVHCQESSNSLCPNSALNEGDGISPLHSSSILNTDCRTIDYCRDKEPGGYDGLKTGSLSSNNDENDETFGNSVGQSPVRSKYSVMHDVVNIEKNSESSNDFLHPSVLRDERSPFLFSGETSSSHATRRLSGSFSSNNSSRSGSISSTGGKICESTALYDDTSEKAEVSDKGVTVFASNKRENNGLVVGIDAPTSYSDSSHGIHTTSARSSMPPFAQSSSCSSSSSYEVPQNFSLGPPLSSNINLPITQLGRVAPTWLPDSEASRCMQCDAAFSFTRRRHHCRACGKIFCGNCSNLKSALQYLENKESRVCSKCYQDLIRAQYYQKVHRKSQSRPNPNNPSEYCSVISPLLQVQSLNPAPLPSVMVPTSGVLRKQGSFKCKSETKQVMFSDGIRPGGDLMEVDGISSLRSASTNIVRRTKRVEKTGQNSTGPSEPLTTGKSPVASRQNTCLIPAFGGLPPIVVNSSSNKVYSLMDSPTVEFVMSHLRNADLPLPVTFIIDKYLAVIVKIVNLDCCVSRVCWSFTTRGMRSVGQDEIVILLECFPDERTLPTDVFRHLHSIYQQASQGVPVTSMGHTILLPGSFGGVDHGGFLFIRHTFQCLERLVLPEPPFLFGILLQKWEIAWAKVFPLRLLLRLGAEFRYYPCPLISTRDRRSVYGEVGHTIMNLLADFHNYQYMVPHIDGLVIHLEVKRTTVKIPTSRYDAVMKVLNGTNGHILALGADFSASADSHLICVQNDDGNYQTQAINRQRTSCKVTGASFVVFNGALKPTPGTPAKSSVVEDGVMIQVTSSMMSEIKQSWKDMKDFTISCGNPSNDDVVIIEWVDDCGCSAADVKSPVDGMSLGGKESRRIHSAIDYAYDDHIIRWTEIFLLCNETNELTNVNRLIDQIAQTACAVLIPHAPQLTDEQMTKIGLRVTINSSEVNFKAGSNKQSLPDSCLNELDEKLLPLLQLYSSSSPSLSMSPSADGRQETLTVELIFNILHLGSMIASSFAVSLPE